MVVFSLIIIILLVWYSSINKATSNGLKAQIVDNSGLNVEVYISDLINDYEENSKNFNNAYLNSKITVTDSIKKIDYGYIDKDSNYSTSYDVITLDNKIKLFVGHEKYEILNELDIGDKITIESKIISCDKVCILRDIEFLDDAGFNYNDNSKINKIK